MMDKVETAHSAASGAPHGARRAGVAVFAHNEEAEIERCLSSLIAAGLGEGDVVHVIVNGSRDGTAAKVRDVASREPRVRLHELALGDKANAWNHYVFNLADPDADFHVFVDGDVEVAKGSIPAMAHALERHPEALAASSLPSRGRTAEKWAHRVLTQHGMPGNFYVLRGATLRRIRDERLYFPVGLIGDDTLLLWLLRRDLAFAGEPIKARIVPVAEASFAYESFPRNSLAGIRALAKRQSRYALRDFQVYRLWQRLGADPSAKVPLHIEEVYRGAPILTQLRAPYGKVFPLSIRKVLFPYTWLRTRGAGAEPRGEPWYAAERQTQTDSETTGA